MSLMWHKGLHMSTVFSCFGIEDLASGVHLESMASLATLFMLALMSPGPDFAMVVRNSLIYSRKTALLTALGIAIGILVHVSYSLLGLGWVIQKNPWLLQMIRYLGAGYLVWMGWNGLRAKKTALVLGNLENQRDISWIAAIQSGFLTGALNPKSMLFFISLFSVVLPTNTPPIIMLLDGMIVFIETLVWFSLIAYCLSGKQTREKFYSVGHWIERATGSILIALGIKLITVSI